MRNLEIYAEKSSLMDIKISYGKEDFDFNLFQELIIDENKINHEAQVQPSAYAFISMLHKKLIRVAKDKKVESERLFARFYVNYKKEIDRETGRQNPKETAHFMATKHPSYQKKVREYHIAEEKAGMIETCVKAFEQRSFLIQTISANIRKGG